MAVIIDSIRNINNYLNKYQDPRTASFPLMSSPFYTLGICLSYVFIVKWPIFIIIAEDVVFRNVDNFFEKKDKVLGPKLMENRKPFQLQRTLVIYNFLQVIFSIWLWYKVGMGGWLTGEYSLRCQPVDYSNKPSTIRMVHASWWYFFSKFTEFMDTMFFVLRKKNDHISTLHVIHHGVMPMSVWFGVKYTPGGHSTFFGFLNTFVHIIMYFYYMLSAIGPRVRKYLWWKKYLTTLQMAQFVGIMVHAFQLLFIDCNYPRAFVWWIGMHAVMFFFLFKEFYNQTYNKKKKMAQARLQQKHTQNGHIQNGEIRQNGVSKDVEVHQNGVSKDAEVHQNGVAKVTNVSEYYVNGSTELHHRIKSK